MPKKIVAWSPEARADLRVINRDTALQILRTVDRYLSTGAGDVKKLRPPRDEFRSESATTEFSSFTKTTLRSRSCGCSIGARPIAEPAASHPR